MINAVLKLAAQGYRLVPIEPNGKRCLIKGWPGRATSDSSALRAWWTDEPDSNVGALCGDGLVVLDRDDRSGGRESLDRLVAEHDLPVTTTVKTPGGRHYHFQYAGSVRSGPIEGYPGLELRADAALVVLPPSVRPAGAYTWERNGARAALPAWLAELRNQPKSNGRLNLLRDNAGIDRVPQGARNATLARVAGALRNRGLGYAAIRQALDAENLSRCVPPLDDREVDRIARSIASYPTDYAATLRMDDPGNAERFVLQHGDSVRWDGTSKRWMHYVGTHWVHDLAARHIALAVETARSLLTEAERSENPDVRKSRAREAAGCQSVSRIKAMLEIAKSMLPVAPVDFDSDLDLFNCPNGTLRLSTGELLPHDPAHLITKCAGAPFDPSAKAPTWDRFLFEVASNDLDLIDYKSRVYGQALTGRNLEQHVLIHHGPGANGKTTEANALLKAFGDYAAQAPVDMLLTKPYGGGISNDIARLRGCRLVAAVEADSGRWLSESVIKSMSGGDRQTARFLFGEFFEFEPSHTLILSTNHKPRIRGTDHGIWRRLRLVPYRRIFKPAEQDKDLAAKLDTELAGILAWCVRGYGLWREGGVRVPDAVSAATTAYREDEDVVGTFLAECIDRVDDMEVGSQVLHIKYVEWADTARHKPMSVKAFSQALEERGEAKVSRARGNVWLGLRVRDT